MHKHLFLVTGLLALAAATASLASAGEHPPARPGRAAQGQAQGQGFDHGMQPVATAAGAGQAGDGWRYFSDPAAHRAVVISPQGDYFLSRGKGMRLVAVTQARS